ncbi:phosphate acyltransferase [Helicobacter sp. 13S00401-1]|uniref:phosphate acyltransferase PlsX n=1 Tax=Helicobacter sp. 13S00401-1 TaxID=1905758 RepID=UPI000BA7D176|nr:phosphate acyltransferase PlsX [Helicobacter sp. 13S00401-1]PAF51748.1 phosphate acyltransferase [Helicobacter sp. 13S00401-1]
MLTISIDAMGADNGVLPIVLGLKNAITHKDFKAVLCGDERLIKPILDTNISPNKLKQIEIIHTDDYIHLDEQASVAIKRKESSIYKAVLLVKDGKADAIVSCGHSGATMGLATLLVGRIEGVSRPAICTCMPSITDKPSIILDAGANTDCKPNYLVDFAIMGYQYAKSALEYKDVKVGLLSNGEEDTKGNELTKETFKLLKDYPFFIGNVEGPDIFNGKVDVVVCDGFMGNLVLKASEGVAGAISTILKQEIKKSPLRMLGASLIKGVFKTLKSKVDYAEYGGAPLLGVKKPVIISHGKSNARAVECALYQAMKTCDSSTCLRIQEAFVETNLKREAIK